MQQAAKILIDQVLDGTIEEADLPMVCVNDVKTHLKNKGFNDLEFTGDELNGWDVSFFYYFVHPKNGKYLFSGSLFYGDFTFAKNDDE